MTENLSEFSLGEPAIKIKQRRFSPEEYFRRFSLNREEIAKEYNRKNSLDYKNFSEIEKRSIKIPPINIPRTKCPEEIGDSSAEDFFDVSLENSIKQFVFPPGGPAEDSEHSDSSDDWPFAIVTNPNIFGELDTVRIEDPDEYADRIYSGIPYVESIGKCSGSSPASSSNAIN